MGTAAFAATGSDLGGAASGYRPGVCNIGEEEIGRRRRAGHIGAIAAVALFAVLIAIDAPSIARLLVAIPAVMAASGYLQAHFRFCAGFGSRGIFNFSALGSVETVVDDDARALDRRRAREIGLASLAIGVAVGIVAVLLPL